MSTLKEVQTLLGIVLRDTQNADNKEITCVDQLQKLYNSQLTANKTHPAVSKKEKSKSKDSKNQQPFAASKMDEQDRLRAISCYRMLCDLRSNLPSSIQPDGLKPLMSNIEKSDKDTLSAALVELGLCRSVLNFALEWNKLCSENFKPVNSDFEKTYIACFSDSFHKELNTIRHESDFSDTKVSLLLNCIENGVDVFSEIEKKLVGESFTRQKKNQNLTHKIAPKTQEKKEENEEAKQESPTKKRKTTDTEAVKVSKKKKSKKKEESSRKKRKEM